MMLKGSNLSSAEFLKLTWHKLGLISLDLNTPRCRTCFVDNNLVSDICGQESYSKADEDCLQGDGQQFVRPWATAHSDCCQQTSAETKGVADIATIRAFVLGAPLTIFKLVP